MVFTNTAQFLLLQPEGIASVKNNKGTPSTPPLASSVVLSYSWDLQPTQPFIHSASFILANHAGGFTFLPTGSHMTPPCNCFHIAPWTVHV